MHAYLEASNELMDLIAKYGVRSGHRAASVETSVYYSSVAPRKVFIRLSGETPPSLNAQMRMYDQEDLELWKLLVSWWDIALAGGFVSTGGRFPCEPLRRPFVRLIVYTPNKLRDLDNYGIKAVVGALERFGVIETDGAIQHLMVERRAGEPQVNIWVVEESDGVYDLLAEMDTRLPSNPDLGTFEHITGTYKTGSAVTDYYQ